MKKWNIVSKYSPPVGRDFWGYDIFTESVYMCSWDGKDTNDDKVPFPRILEIGGNDYSIDYWMEMEQKPNSPNVVLEYSDGDQKF